MRSAPDSQSSSSGSSLLEASDGHIHSGILLTMVSTFDDIRYSHPVHIQDLAISSLEWQQQLSTEHVAIQNNLDRASCP